MDTVAIKYPVTIKAKVKQDIQDLLGKELIAIGKIVTPHGVRGDVRVLPLTDFPERFKELKTVLLDNMLPVEGDRRIGAGNYNGDEHKLTLTGVKYHNKSILIKFFGYNDMNSAEKLKGKLIFIEHKDLVKLPEHHYYNFDIVGLTVYSNTGEYLGIITDIIRTGSNDVYVADHENNQPLLIPALKKVVQVVDIPNGKIIVNLMEEWE